MTALRAAAAVVIAVLALALAACGGGGDGPDLTEGLTPAQIVERSADAARELRSFRLDLEGEVETALTPEAEQQLSGAAGLLRGPIPFSGAGPVVQPDRFSLDVTAEPNGLPIQANLTRVGGDVYLSALGRDFALDLPAEQVRGLDAREVFPALAGWIEEPRREGEEEVGGADTVRLVGTVDARAAARDLATLLSAAPGLSGGAAPTPAELRRSADALQRQLRGGEVTLWVRTEDLRPARARVVLNAPDASAVAPQLRSLRLDLTVELSDYDADLEVTPPATPQPLDLDQLGSLLG